LNKDNAPLECIQVAVEEVKALAPIKYALFFCIVVPIKVLAALKKGKTSLTRLDFAPPLFLQALTGARPWPFCHIFDKRLLT